MPLPPHPDPGTPPAGGPWRYVWWLLTSQWPRVSRGALLGIAWMSATVAEPYFIRGAIDHGLVAGDLRGLLWWSAVMAVTAVFATVVGVYRHRTMTLIRVDAAYRTVQVVARQMVRLGATLPKRVATGEVVTIGSTDIWHISQTLTMTGPGVGSLVALVVVAALLLSISPVLGLLVLLGVPAVTLAIGPLLTRLQRTEAVYRRRQGELTTRASDIVAGLRVLRGIGGEDLFAAGYRRLSGQLRAEGYRVGSVTSWGRSLATGLPALFVALVAWLGARMLAQGAITIGDLVAVYAYAAVLVIPVTFLVDCGRQAVRGLVAARRAVDLLALRPELVDPPADLREPGPRGPADLHDPDSGLTVVADQLLAVATGEPATAVALDDRLGRYVDSRASYGGVPLARLSLSEVRRRILVAEGSAQLFAGTLRDLLSIRAGSDDAAITRCLEVASAIDVVDGLPDGLDTRLDTGALTLSGGQRQRIRLARALLADPEVLILLEPTSAVDAHTEAAIAGRLRAARAGRTTVVATTSPLLLTHADRVAYLEGGQVVATGSHADLLIICPGYRDLVTRDALPAPAPAPAPARQEAAR